MQLNITILKLNLTKQALDQFFLARQSLLDDLIVYATDPTMVKRRFRMLKQLSLYESQILNKIHSFDSEDINDFSIEHIKYELNHVINKSA
jgi:hypothetical protein